MNRLRSLRRPFPILEELETRQLLSVAGFLPALSLPLVEQPSVSTTSLPATPAVTEPVGNLLGQAAPAAVSGSAGQGSLLVVPVNIDLKVPGGADIDLRTTVTLNPAGLLGSQGQLLGLQLQTRFDVLTFQVRAENRVAVGGPQLLDLGLGADAATGSTPLVQLNAAAGVGGPSLVGATVGVGAGNGLPGGAILLDVGGPGSQPGGTGTGSNPGQQPPGTTTGNGGFLLLQSPAFATVPVNTTTPAISNLMLVTPTTNTPPSQLTQVTGPQNLAENSPALPFLAASTARGVLLDGGDRDESELDPGVPYVPEGTPAGTGTAVPVESGTTAPVPETTPAPQQAGELTDFHPAGLGGMTVAVDQMFAHLNQVTQDLNQWLGGLGASPWVLSVVLAAAALELARQQRVRAGAKGDNKELGSPWDPLWRVAA
jgi:hypothetical protein